MVDLDEVFRRHAEQEAANAEREQRRIEAEIANHQSLVQAAIENGNQQEQRRQEAEVRNLQNFLGR